MWITTLGLPDELYWECSPREIDACFTEYYRAQDTLNARVGTICASIFNAVPVDSKQAKKRKWLTWTHFFQPLTSQRKPRNTVAEAKEAWERSNQVGSFSIRRRN